MSSALIKVASPSFSANKHLREELLKSFPRSVFNRSGARMDKKDLAAFLGNAQGAIIGLESVDAEVLRACPRLKAVAKYGVGLDNIDQKACAGLGVGVYAPAGVNKLSVAELTLGLMLALCRNFFRTAVELKHGSWHKDGGCELSGKSVGIIGAGHVGKEVIRLLKPFGCRILVNDIVDQAAYYRRNRCRPASKAEIFKRSDVVTLHTPLTPLTRGMMGRRALGLMKETAFLINTARGPLVAQSELKRALKNGIIAGAAIDVYDEEPPRDKGLLALPNLIATPHIGGNSREAVLGMGRWAIRRLERVFSGRDGE